MQVFLIRHPRPQIADGICYGRLDMPAHDLAATAAALRMKLPPGLPLVSSPLRRCRELAEFLHPAPRYEADLMEIHFGEWEGRRWDEIGTAALDAWVENLLHHAPPGGESAAMLQARVVACLDRLAGEGLAACTIVTHAGVMRAATGHAQRLAGDAWSQLRFAYGECVPLGWPARA